MDFNIIKTLQSFTNEYQYILFLTVSAICLFILDIGKVKKSNKLTAAIYIIFFIFLSESIFKLKSSHIILNYFFAFLIPILTTLIIKSLNLDSVMYNVLSAFNISNKQAHDSAIQQYSEMSLKHYTTGVEVYLTSGDILICDNLHSFEYSEDHNHRSPSKPFSIDHEGNINLYATHLSCKGTIQNKSQWTKFKNPTPSQYGPIFRMTHIPKSQILYITTLPIKISNN